MTKQQKATPADRHEQDIQLIKDRLDMLDERLDNIDTVISAAVERVMKQPVTMVVICPRCGEKVEVSLVGSQRLIIPTQSP